MELRVDFGKLREVIFFHHFVETVLQDGLCVVCDEFLDDQRSDLVLCRALQIERPDEIFSLAQLNHIFHVFCRCQATAPLCTQLIKLRCNGLYQLPFKKIRVQGHVFITGPYQVSLECFRQFWLLNTEVDKDLDTGA